MTQSQPQQHDVVSTAIVESAIQVTQQQQQLVLNVQPYEMCSYEECVSRVRTNEISIYERNYPNPKYPNSSSSVSSSSTSSTTVPLRNMKYDPCKVITKYRRSVASNDDTNTKLPPILLRSIPALYTTIQYLIHHIYIPNWNAVHNTTTYNTTPKSFLFRSKLEFIEDRIRAVQVDIVKQSSTLSKSSFDDDDDSNLPQQQIKQIQYNITKYYIITLYIMSDDHPPHHTSNNNTTTNTLPQNHPTNNYYETTFAHRALQTSIQTYMNYHMMYDCTTSSTTTTISSNSTMDDEMMAYFLLIQFQHQLLQQQQESSSSLLSQYEYTSFWYNMTESYRKLTASSLSSFQFHRNDNDNTTTPLLLQQPFTHYVLQFVFLYINGQYQTSLQRILFVSPSPSTTKTTTSANITTPDTTPLTTQDWNRFRILVQCCLASSIPYIRYQILCMINSSAMKKEQYHLEEVARLLCYHPSHHHYPTYHTTIHSTTTTTNAAATTTTNDTSVSTPLQQPQAPLSQWCLKECYHFCQALQLSVISTNDDHGPTSIIINPNDNDMDPPLVQKNVRVLFKVNTIPSPYSTIMKANTTSSLCRCVRTIDREQSLGLWNPATLVTTTARTTTTTTYTSLDGIVVPTPEWYYNHHIFS